MGRLTNKVPAGLALAGTLTKGKMNTATETAPRDWSGYDYVSALMEFENDSLSDEKTLELFQYLVDTGLAWQLQGFYGRTAANLLERGLIHDNNKLSTK